MARVPDPRLDVLTAMYNPRKRVPATVEFADIPGRPSGSGADALLDVAAYRNADALVHVLRSFTDPAIPHAAGSVDPRRDARAMEDELILADLAVVEKRLDRLAKDLKKTRTRGTREGAGDPAPLQAAPRERRAAARAGAGRRRPAPPAGLPVPLGQAAADRAQRRRGAISAGRARRACSTARPGGAGVGPETRVVAVCAKIELEIAQLEPADAAAFLADLGLDANRGSIASSARATSCSATSRSSRSARTSAARGPSRAARRRRRRPGRFTRTSRAGSSARRWWRTSA